MKTAQLRRLEALEARQPAIRSILTSRVLKRFTDEELAVLCDLFESRGMDEVEDLPADAQARIKTLVEIANSRPEPAPWPPHPRDIQAR